MRLPDQHLSADEIESLGKEEGLSGELGDQLRPAREHAESCPACRRRLEVYPTSRTKLEKLRAPQGAQKGPDCPSIDIWLRLAGSLLNTGEQERYAAHAARCDYCGPVLREVVADFAEPMTNEEKAVLASLKVGDHGWQQASPEASDPANSYPAPNAKAVPRKRRSFGLPAWQFAMALLGIVAILVVSFSRFGFLKKNPDTVASVNELLAKAYGEQRTIQMRIPGAPFGPIQVNLGTRTSHLDQSTSLHDAESILRRQMGRFPEDPEWLDAEARAELLDGDFDAAVKTLEQASRLSPESASIMTDLAAAYFERAAKSDIPVDYGKAADLLGTVLRKSPNDQVALFNRAIVNEQQMLFPEAIRDWKNYLDLDPSGGWSEEAKRHLEKLEQRIKKHISAASEPLLAPAIFVARAKSHDPEAVQQLDDRIEDYQDLAIEQWLPSFVREANQDADTANDIEAALQSLATLLFERHGDSWLRNLLKHPRSLSFASATLHLRDALLASAAGDPTKARLQAQAAGKDFVHAGVEAGQLRAELEQIHALRRAQQGELCLEWSSRLAENLRHSDYAWMLGQVSIDQGSCALMAGKFDLADSFISFSQRVAQEHHYRSLELRGLGIAASVRSDQGDIRSAWEKNESGLQNYWAGSFTSPTRAQQFYDDLSYLAENLEEFHTALAFAQESTRMLSLVADREAEALARRHLANIAVHTGDLSLAAEELKKSEDILAPLSQTEETRTDRLYAEIALAEIDIQRGKLQESGERLSTILDDVGNTASFTIPQRFYGTYGELLLKQGREHEAEEALLHGADIADASLGEISESSSRYFWSEENSDIFRSLVYLELEKQDPERALSAWEWYRSAPLGHLPGKSESLRSLWGSNGIKNVFEQLTDRTVISYASLPAGLAVWVTNNHGTRSQLLPVSPESLETLSTEFTDLCADRTSDLTRLQTVGRDLFDLLIRPIARDLDRSRLVIVEPDDVMADLPFQALIAPDNRYFGETYRLGFSKGMFYPIHLRQASAVTAMSRALVIGSTANTAGSDVSLLPVPDVLDQADEIAAKFSNVVKLLGDKADVESVEVALPSAEIVHFIAHAVSSSNREGVLLFSRAEDPGHSLLWDSHRIIPGLFRRCRLLVLAACSVGKLYRNRREQHGELVDRLLVAGVPQIVASRWNVDSQATREFMNTFYSALLQGQSVTSALQLSSAVLRQNPERHRPFFWAGFAAFGAF